MFVNPHMGSPVASECCATVSFRRSEVIYNQGDVASFWYEVVSGSVRTCFCNRRGQRQVTAFYYGGDVFGVDNCRYAEGAEAVTDLMVRVHRLGHDGQVSGSDESCDAADILRRALDLSRQRVVLLGRKTALQRVAAFILGLPSIDGDSRKRFLPMPRADIADHLCLTIHTVSRIISNIMRNGLISMENKNYIIINNVEKMLEISGDEESVVDVGVDDVILYRKLLGGQSYWKWESHKS